MKSIIQDENNKKCYVCGCRTGLERHHVFFGVAKRPLSEQDGLVVYLCPACHRGKKGVHNNRELDLFIKRKAQAKYEENHTREEYMKRYRKNYLED